MEAVAIKRLKSNDGFTLLEVIISIAALSFISVFILQMFLTSANLNARARSVDIAMAKAITEIENFKSYSTLSAYLSVEGVDTETVCFYYDKYWNDLPEQTSSSRYCLIMNIAADEESSEQKAGVLYTVKTDVSDIVENRSLASLETKKYFPQGFEEGM